MGDFLSRKIAFALVFLWLLALPPLERIVPLTTTTKPSAYVLYFPVVGRNAPMTAPTPAPAPVRPAIGKQGVGLTHSECADQFGWWGYDWSANPPDTCGAETVPMIWGSYVPPTVGGSSIYLLGFNEPDLDSQSNIQPGDAAILWKQIEDRFPEHKLVAPAPSHVHPTWIVDFRNAYIAQNGHPPRLDVLAAHCYYYTADSCIALVKQFDAWAAAWVVPQVWVTEFGFFTQNARTQDAAWNEADKFIRYLNSDPMVRRYAWFAARVFGDEDWMQGIPAGYYSSLLDRDGNLTFWGGKYKAGK